MIAAIVLAAGASRRMGAPKANLRYRGRTFLETILETASAAGLSPRCVVVSGGANITLSEKVLGNCTVVQNPDVASGPIGSAVIGIMVVLNHPVEAALIWHVDQPHVSVASVQALAARFQAGGASIVVPAFSGRRGHPILIAREVFAEVLATPKGGLRTVVRASPARVAEVRVDDPAVLEDIDTPEDYEALIRRENLR